METAIKLLDCRIPSSRSPIMATAQVVLDSTYVRYARRTIGRRIGIRDRSVSDALHSHGPLMVNPSSVGVELLSTPGIPFAVRADYVAMPKVPLLGSGGCPFRLGWSHAAHERRGKTGLAVPWRSHSMKISRESEPKFQTLRLLHSRHPASVTRSVDSVTPMMCQRLGIRSFCSGGMPKKLQGPVVSDAIGW